MTPVENLASIAQEGLQPRRGRSRFGPMSIEAQNKRPKLFYLPILGGSGMKGFIDEWWYGSVDRIAILRIPCGSVEALQSQDPYTARHEVWSYHSVPAAVIEIRMLYPKKSPWRPLLALMSNR